jgi:hypothetical protein
MNKDLSSQLISLPNTRVKNYLILFIFWPFLAFLVALRNYNQKESRKIVYLFLIYYGLAFITHEGLDAYTYALHLMHNAKLPFSDFFKIVGGIYATDTTVDIMEPFISFVISRFTSNHNVLFAVYTAIFGFFYLKSINLLYDRYFEKRGLNAYIFMVFFVVILPITSINGFRMWTAAWIFFYGAYNVILYRDTRYFLLTFGSILMHWSFLATNAVLIIYFFAGNRNLIYLPLAIVSFVLPRLIAPVFLSLSMKLGGGLQNRYENYSSEGYVLATQESHKQDVWFMQIGTDLVFYYLLLTLVVIQLRFGSSMKERPEKNLFSFLLLFLAFINFGISIPSFGGRFQILFFLFATLYIFLYFLKVPGNRLVLLTWLGIFPMALFAAITFRIGSENINTWIFTPGLGLSLLAPLPLANLLF